MKRIISALLSVAFLLLSGCTARVTEKDNIIAVSFYPVYILTLNVVGDIDGLSVECMAEQNTGCLHDYTITAKDARLLSDCSIFVVNGAGMEAFAEDLYETVEGLSILDSSQGTSVICTHNHEDDEEHHSHSHSENSHIWMSVDNAKLQVENICNGLAEAFPQYEEQLRANTAAYHIRLDELKVELVQARDKLQGKKAITFHDAYAYLFNDLGIEVVETIESDEGGEPSAKALGELTEKIKDYHIDALFIEPEYEGSSAGILSNETGIKVYTLNPVLSGDKSKTAYEDIMRENLEVIKAVN